MGLRTFSDNCSVCKNKKNVSENTCVFIFKNRSGKARVDQNNIKFKFSMKRWEIQDQYSATIKVLKLVGLNMVEQN